MKLRQFLLGALYATFAIASIWLTPRSEALIHDATGYYDLARQIQAGGIVSRFFDQTATFIDRGYPTALSILMQFGGTDNIILFQLANYLFWIISAYYIYHSVRLARGKPSRLWLTLMLFSPLYLSFSAKLYSESFAAMGVSLLLYGYVSGAVLPLILGGVIFWSTKSVFLLMLPVIWIMLVISKRYQHALLLLLVPLILYPSIISSGGGGRSTYNLAIQSSKVEQTYDQIIACAPYYLSYPLGQLVAPTYQGVCHQNDPTIDMPGYKSNPYVIASEKRIDGFGLSDWVSTVVSNPFKYILVVVVSLSNIALVEGVYPTILLKFPTSVMFIIFVTTKIIWSILLWYRAIKNGLSHSWTYLIPLIYFVVVVGNFPIEPRYFYPLIPYLYYLAALPRSSSLSR